MLVRVNTNSRQQIELTQQQKPFDMLPPINDETDQDS